MAGQFRYRTKLRIICRITYMILLFFLCFLQSRPFFEK